MSTSGIINHIALVLPSVESTAKVLSQHDYHIGKTEYFEGEGTKEIYIEQNKASSLLLMEPTKPGSYQNALNKRGSGLHHIAIDVLNLSQFLEGAIKVEWVLHPNSLKSINDIQVAWLYKPKFPALIEISEVKEFSTSDQFVKKIKLAYNLSDQKLIDVLGLQEFIERSSDQTEVLLNNKWFSITDLI